MRRHLSILWREYQLAVRGSAFWAVVGFGAVVAAWRASARGTTAALAAYQAWQTVVLAVGVLAALLAGAAAARDRRQAAVELVLAKPGGCAPGLVAVRFLGVWLSMLSASAAILAAASVGQVFLGRTAWHPLPYGAALLLCAIPICLASALGFFLSSVFTPLASAVAALYWVAVSLARLHTPTVLDLRLSQHWPISLLVSAGLVTLAAALYARPVRGQDRSAGRLAWGAAALICAAALSAFATTSRGEDALLEPAPVLAAISGQTRTGSHRAPGFWLPDADGRLVGLADFAGRSVAVLFWSPAVPASARALGVLEEFARKTRPTGLSCVAVCLDRDAATMPLFAGQASKHVAMLWDRGQHFGKGLEWSDSPLAVAYEVSEVPTVFFIDRHRQSVAMVSGEMDAQLLQSTLSHMAAGR